MGRTFVSDRFEHVKRRVLRSFFDYAASQNEKSRNRKLEGCKTVRATHVGQECPINTSKCLSGQLPTNTKAGAERLRLLLSAPQIIQDRLDR